MQDNTLYAIFWGCLATVIISLIVGVVHYNEQELDVIRKSPNPAVTACAMGATTSNCLKIIEANKLN